MISGLLDEEAASLHDQLGDDRRIFAFEADFADDLRCIPMAVRFKLDRVGIKVSLKQWTKIGPANRLALLALRCDAPQEIAAYRKTLAGMIAMHSNEPIKPIAAEFEPAWTDRQRVPVSVVEQATRAELPEPTLDAWSKLSTLERFALLKLARSNHDNDNFGLALREFGIAP